MKLHSDPRERVVLFAEDLPWLDSPAPGVKRRMLERDGSEIARATSIVRYEPGSKFAEHTHGGGEEFLVLDGVFSDQFGDYPAGSYVRNPVGSSHAPFSSQGCIILVKLWQMDQLDQTKVVIDTRQSQWLPGMVEGLTVLPLHSFAGESVALVRWQAGTHFPRHNHIAGEEIYVLEGVFQDEYGYYPKDTWLRNPPGSIHTPFSDKGCLIYVKVGHLNF